MKSKENNMEYTYLTSAETKTMLQKSINTHTQIIIIYLSTILRSEALEHDEQECGNVWPLKYHKFDARITGKMSLAIKSIPL